MDLEAPSELTAAAVSFTRAAAAEGARVVFVLVEADELAADSFAALCIGEEPVWDPALWAAKRARSRNLREQLRRARAKGVCVRRAQVAELAATNAPLRRELERLVKAWLDSRSLAPMGFLVGVHLFEQLEERRIYVAEHVGRVCAVLALVPVYARGGYLVEDLLRAPFAPNGTTELLLDRALCDLAADGCRHVSLGLAPLAGAVEPALRIARSVGSGLYDFAGLRAFKAKFLPDAWVPLYLKYPPQQTRWLSVYALLSAFAQGPLLPFGVSTLLRGPKLVLQALTLLLVPWTLGLAALDSQRFFPSAPIHWAWVSFDVALLGALLVLQQRFRPWLAHTLWTLVACDALLTALEALWFNVPRVQNALEACALGLAIAGPSLAAAVLHGLWRRKGRPLNDDA
jgi:phosphatidylglycerol lysyltransferase